MAESSESGPVDTKLYRGSTSTPVPDPTLLTSAMISREIYALREIMESQINGQREAVEARLSGMDTAVKLLQTIMDRVPAECDAKANNLQHLLSERFSTVDEKFRGIETRISERDDLRKQAASDAKVGIDAALASAEKLVTASNESFALSVDKSERATNKLLDQQAENQKNTASALEDKIVGLKERLDRIEGAAVGTMTAKGEQVVTTAATQSGNSFVLAVVMGVVGMISLLVAIFVAMTR